MVSRHSPRSRRRAAGRAVRWLLQIDNEAAFYFRDAAYDSDYHPDALADFARFLEQR